MFLPASHCIPWFGVLGTVCLAIVILNIIAIIIFVKQRRLQRKSTYLIIHLAIIDLLVGAVTGPLWIDFFMSSYCDLWEYDSPDRIWLFVLERATGYNIDKVSLLNLAFISLERTHATFCPFKHRSVKKWVYGVIITVTWLVPLVMISIVSGLFSSSHVSSKIYSVLFSSFYPSFSCVYMLCFYLYQNSSWSFCSTSWCSRAEGKKTDKYNVSCHIRIVPNFPAIDGMPWCGGF